MGYGRWRITVTHFVSTGGCGATSGSLNGSRGGASVGLLSSATDGQRLWRVALRGRVLVALQMFLGPAAIELPYLRDRQVLNGR